MTEQTVRQFWESQVHRSPTAVAVSAQDGDWTYAEFDAWVNRCANGLRAFGVRRGTMVAVLLPTSASFLRLQLAIAKLGAVIVPLIVGSSAAELAYVVGHAGAELLLTDAVGIELARAGRVAPALGVHIEPPEASGDPPADAGVRPMDPMAIMYTSGSTGKPKGVVQPAASLATTGAGLRDAFGMGPHDGVMCSLPLFHTAATHMAFGSALAAGSTLTLLDTFSRGTFWTRARDCGATVTYMFPAQMAILMTTEPTPQDRDHRIRVCFSHVRNQPFCDRFGIDVCPGWAMTETCGMGTVTRPGTGNPGPGRIGLVYPEDAEVQVRDGQIWFRHRHAMTAYHRDAAATAAACQDGWVASGDRGSLDPDGVLRFEGRLKNMIKRSGENIAGEEVEFALMEHPAVEECVVFAVPDEIRTEEVYAIVCVRPGHEVVSEQLWVWCRERLAAFKVPRFLELRAESFPRLPNGKTNRAAVIAAAEPASAAEAA
jgi:crotonobetaine/carnitine-CoA ligase